MRLNRLQKSRGNAIKMNEPRRVWRPDTALTTYRPVQEVRPMAVTANITLRCDSATEFQGGM